MSDTTITVDGIVADGLQDGPYTIGVGLEATIDLLFYESGESTGHETRHENLLEYIEYANGPPVKTGISYHGVPYYREDVPSRASISTFVVDVVTGSGVGLESFWGVIVGGEDTRPTAGEMRRLRLDVFVLAKHSEYDTKADVQAEFGSSVIGESTTSPVVAHWGDARWGDFNYGGH